jgi:hypothetical protein
MILNKFKVGSVALLGLFLVIKYLGSHWLNKLLGWYFAVTGVASVWKVCPHTQLSVGRT